MKSNKLENLRSNLSAYLFTPVDIAWLVFFRIAFGTIMFWESMLYIAQDKIRHLYFTPIFFFKYFGFEWVNVWPGLGLYIHFYVMAALSLFILFGLWYRTSTILFFLAFTYQFLHLRKYLLAPS